MAKYVVGDIQGCYSALVRVLEQAKFNPENDELWFAGDLVNRGPESLKVLNFAYNLPHKKVVLGNHDLHLLAVAYGQQQLKHKDTLEDILAAPNCDELLDWLRQQPLLHYDQSLKTVMTHAGIPPIWNLEQAIDYADEVSTCLKGENYLQFLDKMYGNTPNTWKKNLDGMKRLRLITNYFTRMRFCSESGELDFANKRGAAFAPANMKPWFAYKHRIKTTRMIFGHWAALNGVTNKPNIIAMDTGYIWGGKLTLLRLDDMARFQVENKKRHVLMG